jgi:hypothetical protein
MAATGAEVGLGGGASYHVFDAAPGQPNWRLAATLTGGLSARMSAAGEKRQTSTEYDGKF